MWETQPIDGSVLGIKESFSLKSFRPEIIKGKKVKLICHKAAGQAFPCYGT